LAGSVSGSEPQRTRLGLFGELLRETALAIATFGSRDAPSFEHDSPTLGLWSPFLDDECSCRDGRTQDFDAPRSMRLASIARFIRNEPQERLVVQAVSDRVSDLKSFRVRIVEQVTELSEGDAGDDTVAHSGELGANETVDVAAIRIVCESHDA
ncbi:MAG: hypothetical protein ABJC79_13035, partial [Acidimicrobiia bacterium]